MFSPNEVLDLFVCTDAVTYQNTHQVPKRLAKHGVASASAASVVRASISSTIYIRDISSRNRGRNVLVLEREKKSRLIFTIRGHRSARSPQRADGTNVGYRTRFLSGGIWKF